MYYDADKLEYGLAICKRFFPNGKYDTFDHNKIRKEIVSYDTYHNDWVKELYTFINHFVKNDSSITHFIGEYVLFIDEKADEELIEKVVSELKEDEQLLYWERYLGCPLTGKKGFEFCGCDVGECSCSSITSCDFIIEPQFERHFKMLNKYGIFDSIEDAIDFNNALKEIYPDEPHACNCDIWAIWRRIK